MLNEALQRRLQTGQRDSRSAQGIYSRGANVYNGGSMSAHSGGGPQFGRPKKNPAPVDNSNSIQSMFPNPQGNGLVNMSPQPVNPIQAAIMRRLKGNVNDNY